MTQLKHRAAGPAGSLEAVAAPDPVRLQQLLDVLSDAASADREPVGVAERLAHAIELVLGVPGVALGHVTEGRHRLLAASGAAARLCHAGIELAPADRPLATPLAARLPVRFELADPTGSPWLVSVLPLRTGRFVGGLHLLTPPQTPPSPETIGLARAAAAIAALALDAALRGRRLEATARWKGDVLTSMAHDLRTPLNALVGYTSLLRDGDFGVLAPAQLEVVATLERQALELVDLLGAALDVARLETGRLPVRSESIDLAELCGQLAAGTFAQATRAQTITWSIAPELPPLCSDRLKIKQMLQNLVDNALKHAGSAPVDVSVAPAPSGQAVRVVVRDRGHGVAREILPDLFEPGASGGGGTGFGLYIVRSFAEALGGRVAAHSTPGQGTAVTIELPLRAPQRGHV